MEPALYFKNNTCQLEFLVAINVNGVRTEVRKLLSDTAPSNY